MFIPDCSVNILSSIYHLLCTKRKCMDALTSIASSPKQKKHFLSNSEYYFPLSICKTTRKKPAAREQQP